MEKLYAIRLKRGAYIMWSDDKWYETTMISNYVFTRERAMEIINNELPKHFQYLAFIVDREGNEERYSHFGSKKKGNFNISFNGIKMSLPIKIHA